MLRFDASGRSTWVDDPIVSFGEFVARYREFVGTNGHEAARLACAWRGNATDPRRVAPDLRASVISAMDGICAGTLALPAYMPGGPRRNYP